MQPLVSHSPSHPKNIPQYLHPLSHSLDTLDPPLSFFDKSELNYQHMAFSGPFQAQADRSQGLFNLEREAECRDYYIMLKAQNSSEQTQQDHLYSVLSFRRGFSEQYENGTLRREESSKGQALVCEQSILQVQLDNNQFIFPNQENYSIEQVKNEARQPAQQSKGEKGKCKQEEKKITTKNVTKNMGKILFKWIWTHRHKLQSRLTSNEDHWHQFIANVKQWKKENNITRKFLIQKWHSMHPTSPLFRIVSAHFFRTRCIASIYQSNIQEKQIHSKRIRRFLQGVSDGSALDSLN